MTTAPSSGLIYSSKQNPCPICGRTKDGDCRISADRQEVICHHPKDLEPGSVENGWAFTGNTRDERAGHFTIDKQRGCTGPARVVPFRTETRDQATTPSPKAAPISGPIELARCQPVDFDPSNRSWRYSPTQGTKRVDDPKGKSFVPHHLIEQEWQRGAGPAPWPAYREADAIQAPGSWVLEAEGEKCADIIRAGGRVAISQPGHAHTVVQIRDRYQRLVNAGVLGIVYLEDNDQEGRKRSQQSKDAAAAVGLPLLVLPASEVWPGLPEKGSIDDAPGSAAERVAGLEKAIETALQRQQEQPEANPRRIQPLSIPDVRGRLQEAISEGVSGADLVALTAELAAAADQPQLTVKRLADAIRDDHIQAAQVEAEAASIAAEADRQEIGQGLTPAYLLPATIAAAIQTRARYLPCDGPSAVLPFLAAAAGVVKLGARVEACAAAGYRVPINLFTCLVGRSGAKKSPIGRLLAEEPLNPLRSDLDRINIEERHAWEEACRELKKGDPRPPEPQLRRISVSDFTGEALAAQLETQEAAGLGLLVIRDELSGLFGSLNAYRGGRGADEQQLLELFDGAGLSSLRIVGGRHYSRSQVSIWGSTQPDVLRQLVADGDASGLWARFLFVPLPERAVPLPLDTSAAEVAEVAAAAQTLADACGAIYRLPPQTYRLAPAAAERFAHYELSRQRAALGASIGAQSALYGKSAGKVLRLAGVLHLLQIAAGEIDRGNPIEPGTIDRAAALVDHLDAWALGLHAEVAAGGVGGLMRTIHRAAEAAGGPIRWSQLLQRLSKQQRKETDPAAAAEAMRALAAAGYGEVEAGKRGALSYRATRALP